MRESAVPGTTQQHAVTWLREAIVTRVLRPGQRVNQEGIAAEIGVSVAPVREALRVLEQEGQVTYLTRRGYFVTELRIADLEEIYELRRLVETHLARSALPTLDDQDVARIRAAADDCLVAARAADVVAELEANRRFHTAILSAPGHPHGLRHVQLLWDSTEAYRALYYNDPEEREQAADAHERIIAAIDARDPDALVAALDAHRERALDVLRTILRED
jgi:DNA-binding GntR family transcriptional regulator